MRTSCIDVVLAELAAAGIRDVERSHGGKHTQLRWRVNGSPRVRVFTVPVSASDWRAPHNARSEIRRILREDGVLPERQERPLEAPPPRKPDRVTALESRVGALEELVRAMRGNRP